MLISDNSCGIIQADKFLIIAGMFYSSFPRENETGPEIGVRFLGPDRLACHLKGLDLGFAFFQGLIKGSVNLHGFLHRDVPQGHSQPQATFLILILAAYGPIF